MALASLKVTTPSQTGGGGQPGTATVQSVKVTVPETIDLVLLTGADGPVGPPGPPGITATWRGVWASGTTYTAGPPPDGVLGSNGRWYVSLTSGNIGHDPTTDGGVHWGDTSGTIVTSPVLNETIMWNGSTFVSAGTQAPGDNSVKPATTAFVDTAVAAAAAAIPTSVLTFGVKGDGKILTDGAVSGATLSSASLPFASSAVDVGKAVIVQYPSAATVTTTITAFTDTGHVTLATSPGNGTGLRFAFGTDDTDNTVTALAAVTSTTTGGALEWPQGRVYIYAKTGQLDAISLPPDNANQKKFVLTGYGATIVTSGRTPNFIGFAKNADYDTFRNITVQGFRVDAMNVYNASTTRYSTCLLGAATGAAANQTKINYENIIVRDIDVENLPTTISRDPASTRLRAAILLSFIGDGTQQVSCKNVLVENVVQHGGAYGANIFGEDSSTSGPGAWAFYDNITFKRYWHHAGAVIDPASALGTTLEVGGSAYGNRVLYENCYAFGVPDVAFEIDNALNGTMRTCVTEECGTGPFGYVGYNFPAEDNGAAPSSTNNAIKSQQCLWEDCHAIMRTVSTNIPAEAFPNPLFQINPNQAAINGNTGAADIAGGTFTIRDCSASRYASGSLAPTFPIGVFGPCEALVVENFTHVDEGSVITDAGWYNSTIGSAGQKTAYPATTQAGGAKRISVDGFYTRRVTTVSAANAATTVLDVGYDGGTLVVDIRNVVVDWAFSGANIATFTGTALSVAGFTDDGSLKPAVGRANIEGLEIIGWTGATSAWGGVVVGDSTELTINGRVDIHDCDFTGMGAGSEFAFYNGSGPADTTNAPKTYLRDIAWKTGVLAPSTISPTGSPFTYRNLDGYPEDLLIEGGTVSAVAISRNNSTFYTVAAATNARVAQVQNGDYVKITYTSAPTITKAPAA